MLVKTGSSPSVTDTANGQQAQQQRKTRHDHLRRANAIRSRSKSSVG